MRSHVELQRRLLQCAGSNPPCDRVSKWVVQAIRPSDHRGWRTDLTLFGLCGEHHRQAEAIAATLGYRQLVVVEWSGIGALLEEMEQAGFLVA